MVEMWNHHIQDPLAISSQGFLAYLKIFIQINHNVTLVPPLPPPQGANLYCDGIEFVGLNLDLSEHPFVGIETRIQQWN
jgi:hypothetical protein